MNSSKTSYTPILIVLLIVGSFFLGSLITKVQYLEKAGVTGTPSLYINGRLIVGAQPFTAFKTIIEEELKK